MDKNTRDQLRAKAAEACRKANQKTDNGFWSVMQEAIKTLPECEDKQRLTKLAKQVAERAQLQGVHSRAVEACATGNYQDAANAAIEGLEVIGKKEGTVKIIDAQREFKKVLMSTAVCFATKHDIPVHLLAYELMAIGQDMLSSRDIATYLHEQKNEQATNQSEEDEHDNAE